MNAEVKMPEVGESITEGLLVEWLRSTGDVVGVDAPLCEVETDKITVTVTAEAAGRLKTLVEAGGTVSIGQVLATIDTEASAGDAEQPSNAPAAPPISPPAGKAQVKSKLPTPTEAVDLDALSPAVRRMVEEKQLNPADIDGSGRGGRITKGDVISELERRQATESDEVAAPPAVPAPAPEGTAPAPQPRLQPAERQTRTPLSPMRQRIAERLVEAQQTAAILSTFNEADMSQVMALRSRFKDRFKEKHEIGLGFMSFFVKAVVEALKAVPQINAQIQGDEIVHNNYYDIGVAVGTPRGLVVPVVRDADQLTIAETERAIADLAGRARAGTLTLPELTGGVFTISNGGVYGSLLSTPILNPPQSGILGMHSIKKRAVVVDDQIVIRPMMYLAVSYDHRLVDGEQAVTFLRQVVERIEHPASLILEV